MKKNLIPLLLLASLYSCQSKEEKLVKELEPIIQTYCYERLKGAGVTIDSITIIKIDSLTEKWDTTHSFNALFEKIQRMEPELDAKQREVQNTLNLLDLSSGVSQSLYSTSKDDYKKAYSEYEEMVAVKRKMVDRLKSLERLSQSGKLDSTTMTGHIVLFNVKAHDKSHVANDHDSVELCFDLAKRIKIKPEFKY